jgi:breast cancer 2 susceptibility protein
LIAAQDSPASLPMVLCVSNIIWTPGGIDEHGIPDEPIPDVEVTDGWYRMRLEVDEPLLRALRKKRITVGRKLAVVGARVLFLRHA